MSAKRFDLGSDNYNRLSTVSVVLFILYPFVFLPAKPDSGTVVHSCGVNIVPVSLSYADIWNCARGPVMSRASKSSSNGMTRLPCVDFASARASNNKQGELTFSHDTQMIPKF